MIFYLGVFSIFPYIFSSIAKIKSENSFLIYLFPPLWFTGLYEFLVNGGDPLFSKLSLISISATLFFIVFFIIFSILSYRRIAMENSESKNRKGRFISFFKKISLIAEKIFLPTNTQRAIFNFFLKTLKRSSLHRTYLGAYKALAFGIIIFLCIPKINPQNLKNILEINKTLLSVPLIISFLIIAGIRIIITIPAFYEANWIFKLTEKREKKDYILGLKKGVLFYLFPYSLTLLMFYSIIWGIKISLLHILYAVILSAFLTEILFSNLKKIPFTCTFVPGKTDIKNYWPIYLFSFIGYLYTFRTLEYLMIKNNFLFLLFSIFSILSIVALSNHRRYSENFNFIYEDEPEPSIVSLNLNG